MSGKKERGEWFLLLFVIVIAAGLLYLDWWRQGELVELNERVDGLERTPGYELFLAEKYGNFKKDSSASVATQPLPEDAA